MENVLEPISQLFVFIASLVCFVAIVKRLIPAVSLKVHYSVDGWLGRGCKKYKYPSGRAVVYEPHPSMRKYVNKYALLVNDGYKYLKCRLDAAVKTVKFEVVMLNNKNKVIDVLSVYAKMSGASETGEILLHPDTSYVAINLEAVNESAVRKTVRAHYTVLQLLLYFVLITAAVFAEMKIAAKTIGDFLSFVLDMRILLSSSSSFYFACALAMAAIAVFMVICFGIRKGIEVTVFGKK